MRSVLKLNIVSITLGLIFAHVACGATTANDSPVTRYAILDFETSSNIVKTLADDIYSAFRNEIAKQPKNKVIDRHLTESLLAGRQCSLTSFSKDCFSEAGRLLGADKIVKGNIVLYNNVYYLIFALVDAKTGEIENISEDEFAGEGNKLVELAVNITAQLTTTTFYTRSSAKPYFFNPAEMFEFLREVYDNPSRDVWQKPEAVTSNLMLKPGDTVADMGTGPGYFIPWFSRAVGDKGVVYAVDTQKKMIDYVATRAAKSGFKNVRPIHATAGDPSLEENSVDVLFLSAMYYAIRNNPAYLLRLKKSLKKAGKLVIVDFKVPDFQFGPSLTALDSLLGKLSDSKVPLRISIPNILEINHNKNSPAPIGPTFFVRLPKKKVIEEVTSAGFRLYADHDFLPYQYFLVFAKD